MAALNEVKVNIRHNILLLKTFTVPELQDITGLKRQSIYTEVRRMEEKELISRIGTRKREKGSAGGRPPILYRLASDPEKRFEVLQSVRAFYIEAEEESRELPRPESKHYSIAKEMLDEIRAREHKLTQGEKTDLFAQMNKRLEYAHQEEGVGKEGTDLIAASLDILKGEAIDILLGDWDSAVKLLDDARKVCVQFEAEDRVAEIDSYVQTIVDRIAKKQRRLYRDGQYEEVESIVQDLRIIGHHFGDLSGVRGNIEWAEVAASEAREKQIAAKAEQRAYSLIDEAVGQRLRVLIDQVPRMTERQPYLYVGEIDLAHAMRRRGLRNTWVSSVWLSDLEQNLAQLAKEQESEKQAEGLRVA